MNKKEHSKSKIKNWLLIIAAFFVALIICLWPTNYVIESPGQASPISSLIKTKSKYNYHNLYYVTVSERPAVLIDYLTSYLRPFDSRYTKKEIQGDASNKQYNEIQKYYMQTSQNNALVYAAKKANVPYSQKYLGVYVMSILSNSTFKDKLQIGDNIQAVNDKNFRSTAQLQSYLNHLAPNTPITLKVIRAKHSLTMTGKTVKIAGTKQVGIGIQLIDHSQVKTIPRLAIDAGDIGGPSAGLMFSLAAYQYFIHQKLSITKVAGTGTIDEKGHVGMIGGIDKKVVAASKQGIKVFFAPAEQPVGIKQRDTNYAEAVRTAKKIHTKMKIIPVNNFNDALSYLNTHKI
ncbi:SepM family pheromone-processing serine protease [Lactobacillus sp. PV034]|uniref:SepM family pheromone-processing serine protease n=1 Tax=Lactobacillus sp. PV034 TaxID=2594495 RepID=UPI00223EB2CF|nr:SepM family pheromone-processing serine protease [Lactobacillus sp. PV034]QNQ80582.1 PDZ domain-containing protein [Lactobacillus sp. PV034]